MLPPQESLPASGPGPIGPAQWTARNWLGVALYLLLFATAVYGIWRLARPVAGEEDGGGAPPNP